MFLPKKEQERQATNFTVVASEVINKLLYIYTEKDKRKLCKSNLKLLSYISNSTHHFTHKKPTSSHLHFQHTHHFKVQNSLPFSLSTVTLPLFSSPNCESWNRVMEYLAGDYAEFSSEDNGNFNHNNNGGVHFTVDDLLDFSKEDETMTDAFFDTLAGNSGDSSTVTAVDSCNSSVSGGGDGQFNGNVSCRSFNDSQFSGNELCVPVISYFILIEFILHGIAQNVCASLLDYLFIFFIFLKKIKNKELKAHRQLALRDKITWIFRFHD